MTVDRIQMEIAIKHDKARPQSNTYLEIDDSFRYYYKLLTSMDPNDKEYARIEMKVKELVNQIANRQRIISETRESLIRHSGIAKWQRLLRHAAPFPKFW